MSKIYISEDTFSALISVIQKGILQQMNFFIYDSGNILQNRIWTFSSPAFIPNVKSDDKLLNNHKVPVVISTNITEQPLEGYCITYYETPLDRTNIAIEFIAFVKTKEEIPSEFLSNTPNESIQIFHKVGVKWDVVGK